MDMCEIERFTFRFVFGCSIWDFLFSHEGNQRRKAEVDLSVLMMVNVVQSDEVPFVGFAYISVCLSLKQKGKTLVGEFFTNLQRYLLLNSCPGI